jgi:hypothetical protein
MNKSLQIRFFNRQSKFYLSYWINSQILNDVLISLDGLKHFEASDVIIRSDGLVMYVVFDNSFRIGAFCTLLAKRTTNCTDALLEWPDENARHLKSDFEGIAYNLSSGTYFVVQETVMSPHIENTFQPNIFEISIATNDGSQAVEILESCLVNWLFDSDSKGFEGLEFVVHQKTGKSYLLGLCEANDCASMLDKNRDPNSIGEGRLILLEKRETTARGVFALHP